MPNIALVFWNLSPAENGQQALTCSGDMLATIFGHLLTCGSSCSNVDLAVQKQYGCSSSGYDPEPEVASYS